MQNTYYLGEGAYSIILEEKMEIKEPAVGICVLTFRRPELLINMLLQIKERTLYQNYKVYIVIDHEEDRITLKKIEESRIVETLPIEKIEMFSSSAEAVKVVNRGYSIGDEPYFVWLNDDMEVEEGWLREAMKCMQSFPDKEGLVIFRDGIQNGRNATAGLISRNYIKTKLNNIFQNEIYKHYYADTELFMKSRMINKVKYCPAAIVWHNHPGGKGNHKIKPDDVYIQSSFLVKIDQRIYNLRKKKGFK